MTTNNNAEISNPLLNLFSNKVDAIIYAQDLMGTVRSKSANGLMMHSELFNIVAIVDSSAAGSNTAEICPGVTKSVPIVSSIKEAVSTSKEAKAFIILQEPETIVKNDFMIPLIHGLTIINTTFSFIKDIPEMKKMIGEYNCRYYDLRDVSDQKAYPDTNIVNRKARVVFVTGTDCGLGKRTAAFELTQEARKHGINATMYATGQTGLMLGEKGTVIDALIIEFANGVISKHIMQLDAEGYELIFVEGQSDIFHPANSAMSLALLHGANPDCIILVHDQMREYHKGFEEKALLYKMHPLKRHIDTLKMLSLPCGPEYKTVGIATIGAENIYSIKEITKELKLEVADVRKPEGPRLLLNSILSYLDYNPLRILTRNLQLN